MRKNKSTKNKQTKPSRSPTERKTEETQPQQQLTSINKQTENAENSEKAHVGVLNLVLLRLDNLQPVVWNQTRGDLESETKSLQNATGHCDGV